MLYLISSTSALSKYRTDLKFFFIIISSLDSKSWQGLLWSVQYPHILHCWLWTWLNIHHMPTQPKKQNLFKKIKMYWSTSKFMLCEYPINICNFILPWCVLCIITCFMQGYVNHLLKLNFLEKLQVESQLLPKVETAKFFFSSFFLCIMPGETICYILSWLLWTISYNALPEKRTQTKLQKKQFFLITITTYH